MWWNFVTTSINTGNDHYTPLIATGSALEISSALMGNNRSWGMLKLKPRFVRIALNKEHHIIVLFRNTKLGYYEH